MTEREKTNKMREAEIKRIKEFYEKEGFMVERVLSQNSPSSLILFSEDDEKNERYVEVKFIVKKADYEPDEDIDAFKAEVHSRAVKKVKAELNKLNKKERAVAEQKAEARVKELIDLYTNGEE